MGKLTINEQFGTIPDKLLNRDDISLKAKGLFAFLQSKPNDWKFSVKRMTKQLKEGRLAISNTIKELENACYLKRTLANKKKGGEWDGYDYTLYENPYARKPVQPMTHITENLYNISKKEYSKKDIVKKNIQYMENFSNFPNSKNSSSLKKDQPIKKNTPISRSSIGQEEKKVGGKKEEVKKNLPENKNSINSINAILGIFASINPTLNWSNLTIRKAAADLIKQFGFKETVAMAEQTVSVQGKTYAPTVVDPWQMKKKLAQVKIYFDREKNQEKVIDYIKIS